MGRYSYLDDDTIRIYRNTYLNQGAEPLLKAHNKGTSPLLNHKQLDALDTYLTENVYMNSKGIVGWVNNEFGIS